MSSTADRNEAYLADIRNMVAGLTMTRGPETFDYHLPCHLCDGPVVALRDRRKLPAQIVRKWLINHGWQLARKSNAHTCPAHKKETEMTPTSPPAAFAAAPAVDAAILSEKAKVARREAVMLLADVFDVGKGAYKGGESDATVGATVNLAAAAVEKLRLEFYGPLKLPSELETLRSECERVIRAIDKMENELKKDVEMRCHLMREQIGVIGSNVQKQIAKFGA